jgi:hypothetical protein
MTNNTTSGVSVKVWDDKLQTFVTKDSEAVGKAWNPSSTYKASNYAPATGTAGAYNQYGGGTGAYIKACKHDGDDIVWTYRETDFTVANRTYCDIWNADIILDLNRNIQHEGFVESGPARFLALNAHFTVAEVVHLDWPDMTAPPAPLKFWEGMLETLTEKPGKVMISCHGGHGRSGTALAALMVASGISGSKAIEMVRGDHCKNAIETAAQEDYIRYDLGKEQKPVKKTIPPFPGSQSATLPLVQALGTAVTSGDRFLEDDAAEPYGPPYEYCIHCCRDFEVPSQVTDVCQDCSAHGLKGIDEEDDGDAYAAHLDRQADKLVDAQLAKLAEQDAKEERIAHALGSGESLSYHDGAWHDVDGNIVQ